MKPLIFRIILLFISASTLSMIIESGWDSMYGTWFMISLSLLIIECFTYLIQNDGLSFSQNDGCGTITRSLFKKK